MNKYYNSLDEFIKNFKSDIVHFTFCNKGGIKLAINLAKSCKKVNLPLVFFGLDIESIRELKKYAITVNNINDNKYRLDFSKTFKSNQARFKSKEFAKLMWIKYEIGKAILNSNRTIIYLDVDIVVKKNYQNNILNYFEKDKNLDGLFMYDPYEINELCAGFFAINKKAKDKFFRIYSEEFLLKNNYKNLEMMDQEFLNKVVINQQKNLLNIRSLPSKYYPVGTIWYKNYSNIKKQAKLVHYNYLKGDIAKILMMLKYRDYHCNSFFELSILYFLFCLSRIKWKIILIAKSISKIKKLL